MTDGPGGTAIDELAVRIIGDASPLLADVEQAVEAAKKGLEGLDASTEKTREALSEADQAANLLTEQFREMAVSAGMAVPPEVLERFRELSKEFAQAAMEAETSAEIMQAGGRYTQGIEALKKEFPELSDALDKFNVSQERASRSSKSWAEQAFSVEGIIKKLGLRLIATLGPVALFFKAVQAVRKMLMEAEKAVFAYDAAMFRLEVSVRAAQRVMGDAAGTIAEWSQAARDIAERYGLYTETAMLEVAAAVRRTTLQFGLNADAAMALTDAGVALATVFGESPGGVTQALAAFVAAGQNPEALRQFGLDVGEVALQTEAMRMGYAQLYRDLPRTEQVLVRQSLILRQTAAYAEDATQAQERLGGEVQAQAAAVQTQLVQTGTAMATVSRLARGFGNGIKLFFANVLEAAGQLLTMVAIGLSGLIGGIAGSLMELGDQVNEFLVDLDPRAFSLQRIADAGAAATLEAQRSAELYVSETIGALNELGDAQDTAAQRAEEFAERTLAAFASLQGMISSYRQDLLDALAQLDEDYFNQVTEVYVDANRRREENARRYQEDAERDLRDHLLKMQRMEEDYLLDLEDAVRERDARAVLLLMRKHRIDVRRAEEDAGIQRRDRREDFEQEMRDIAEQAEIRKQELYNQWQERRQMEIQEAREHFQELVAQWVTENDINAQGIAALHQMLVDEYGQNGAVVALFDAAADSVVGSAARIVQASSTAMAAVNQVYLAWARMERGPTAYPQNSLWGAGGAPIQGRGVGGMGWNPYTGYQTGGDFIATGPRTIRVGEGRPEAVSIRPLSGAAPAGAAAPGGGHMEIDLNVRADPRLIVEASEAAMSEVADVFINITRVSREGRT